MLYVHIWALYRMCTGEFLILKKHLIFNHKEKSTNCTVCHFLFHTTILQSWIHSPNFRNKIFIYRLLFLPDPNQEHKIPDRGKSSGAGRIRIHNTGRNHSGQPISKNRLYSYTNKMVVMTYNIDKYIWFQNLWHCPC